MSVRVPFNDLSRIHLPLLESFEAKLKALVIDSAFVLGEEVATFESSLAQLESCKYAIGVNNGTTAIELGLRSIGIGIGDEVICPAFTFIASVFAIQRSGATPVLADIDENSPILNLESVESLITPRTKAILLVTLHGRIHNLESFKQIANSRGLALIIDGAQSHLGRYHSKPLTDFADFVTLSFYPGKNLGALGEGGAVLTNSKIINDSIKVQRDWGAKKKYEHEFWGGNFRIETIQAAFINVKIPHLGRWTGERKLLALRYKDELPDHLLSTESIEGSDHVYHMFTIQVNNREEWIRSFDLEGIGWGIHYPRAIHQNAEYSFLSRNNSFPNSEKFARSTFSLPIFPGMSSDEQDLVIRAVKKLAITN